VPHLPCDFHCEPTLKIGRCLLAVAERSGHAAEADWLQEILSWPAEWSALHGIAEIKTPVLKCITRTDHTDLKYTVRWRGESFPREGAAGLAFPYRPPKRPPMVSLRSASLANAGARPNDDAGIIDGVLVGLAEAGRLDRRTVRLRLTNYFNIVQLDDGSVGAAANYAPLAEPELEDRCRFFERELNHDQLLLQVTKVPGDHLALSVRVATISALCTPILRQGGDARFVALPAMPGAIFTGARSAVVIGFGGYMHALAGMPSINTLHVADLQYGRRRAEMDTARERYQAARPDLIMTMSDGSDLQRRLIGADLVCITGSALCNGSMESLLQAAASCPRVIVQGQSAAIYPAELFQRGVTMVSTTLKPANLIDLSDADLRRTLEGGLAGVYLTPRNRRS